MTIDRELILKLEENLAQNMKEPEKWRELLSKSRESDGWQEETVATQDRLTGLPIPRLMQAARLINLGVNNYQEHEFAQRLADICRTGHETDILVTRAILATVAEIIEEENKPNKTPF